MGDKQRQPYNFKDFKLKVSRKTPMRIPLDSRSYNRWGSLRGEPVHSDFTLDEIIEIICSGDVESCRELSRYFYRTNGEYKNNIDYLAHLPLYDGVIVPVYQEGQVSETQTIKAFYAACDFIDKLDIKNTFARITTEWLKTGIYYGILRENDNQVTIQDLPLHYCRSRFKDFNNLNVLEFNLNYFNTIIDEAARQEAVNSFPLVVQRAYKKWISNTIKQKDAWVIITSLDGGICFNFGNNDNNLPLLLASIPDLKQLKDAVGREEKRDENELYKLLIQQMPIDNNGELVFQLDEVADIHSSVAAMLQDLDTVDVLTTFGNTKLESLQETSAASQSNDRIDKYKKNAYDALGRSSLIFNADGSSSLSYSIKKDEALMIGYLNVYETWITYQLNERFARKGLTFDFEILPTTVFNRQDLQQAYFRGAQYGYSKMFAGVAMGIKQKEQLSLMNFENEFLHMSSKMIPLQSSYTTSGTAVAAEGKNNSTTQKTTITTSGNDLDNKGGRPELPDEEKSEKTQANIAAAG